jgi:hypothetical protein
LVRTKGQLPPTRPNLWDEEEGGEASSWWPGGKSSVTWATVAALATCLSGPLQVFIELQNSLNHRQVRPKPGSGLRHFIKPGCFPSPWFLRRFGFWSLVISAVLAALGKFMSGFRRERKSSAGCELGFRSA